MWRATAGGSVATSCAATWFAPTDDRKTDPTIKAIRIRRKNGLGQRQFTGTPPSCFVFVDHKGRHGGVEIQPLVGQGEHQPSRRDTNSASTEPDRLDAAARCVLPSYTLSRDASPPNISGSSGISWEGRSRQEEGPAQGEWPWNPPLPPIPLFHLTCSPVRWLRRHPPWGWRGTRQKMGGVGLSVFRGSSGVGRKVGALVAPLAGGIAAAIVFLVCFEIEAPRCPVG